MLSFPASMIYGVDSTPQPFAMDFKGKRKSVDRLPGFHNAVSIPNEMLGPDKFNEGAR